jgi:hypothetical protein
LGIQGAEVEPSLADMLAQAEDLTGYAVAFRYLEASHEPDPIEATSALQIAGRVHERIRSLVHGAE